MKFKTLMEEFAGYLDVEFYINPTKTELSKNIPEYARAFLLPNGDFIVGGEGAQKILHAKLYDRIVTYLTKYKEEGDNKLAKFPRGDYFALAKDFRIIPMVRVRKEATFQLSEMYSAGMSGMENLIAAYQLDIEDAFKAGKRKNPNIDFEIKPA